MKPPSRRRFPFREEVRPLKDDEEIGHRWKRRDACSLVILIGRGLDLRNARRGLVAETEAGSESGRHTEPTGGSERSSDREKTETMTIGNYERRQVRKE